MGETGHFSRGHSLTLCDDRTVSSRKCSGCRREISGPGYRCSRNCRSCQGSFSIDEACYQLPSQITHPLHPQHTLTIDQKVNYGRCDVCGLKELGFFYTCCSSDCKFKVDLVCAWLDPTKNHESSTTTTHEHHHLGGQRHPFILCEMVKNFGRRCSACRLMIEDSMIYVCIQCKILLHKSCAESPPEIKHPFHPQHPLFLLATPYRDYVSDDADGVFDKIFYDSQCHACGYRGMRFFFSCLECQFQLDVACASLTPTKSHEVGGGHDDEHQFDDQLQHLGQNHPLIVCDVNKNFSPSCSACLLSFDDSMMIYVCLECKLLLHRSCTKLPTEIQHPFHPQGPLTFLLQPAYGNVGGFLKCEVCLGSINYGCSYKCSNSDDHKILRKRLDIPMLRKLDPFRGGEIELKCNFHMHAKCASLKPTISSISHPHPLALIKAKESFKFFRRSWLCYKCSNNLPSLVFRCVECNYNFHIGCHPSLPHSIKYESHRHPLTLTYSPVKDSPDEDEDAELYCDACETRRKLVDPVYYCVECHFVTHVDCDHVLPQVVRLLEEDSSLTFKNEDTKLETSTDVIKKNIDEDIAKLRAKVGARKADLAVRKAELKDLYWVSRTEDTKLETSVEVIKENIDEMVGDAMKAEETKLKNDARTSEKVEIREIVEETSYVLDKRDGRDKARD